LPRLPTTARSLAALLRPLLARAGGLASLALAAAGPGLAEPSPSIEYRSLPELLEMGSRALAAGDFAAASAAFRSIETTYSEEPEWRDGRLPRRLLPLSGFASYKAGAYEAAVATLDNFLGHYSDSYKAASFARYLRAAALEKAGREADAIEAFRQFREASRSPGQRAVAAAREGRLLARAGDAEAAIDLLASAGAGEEAAPAQTRARLSAIQLCLKTGQPERAAALLLERPWKAEAMPEVAVLSMLAFRLGDALMEARKPAQALRAYRLVWPRAALVEAQQAKLRALEERFRRRRGRLGMEGQIWEDFYSQLLAALRAQLEALEATEAYDDGLLLRRGQAYLQTGRSEEARLCFERLARDEEAPLARQAHYLWILAARDEGDLGGAATIAEAYLESYPSDPAIGSVLHLVGVSRLEAGRYVEAIDALEAAFAALEDAETRAVCLYQTGYCHAQLESYAAARESFARVGAAFPEAPIAPRAALWLGLTHFLEGSFEKARAWFADLEKRGAGGALHSEIVFRHAAALRGLGRWKEALDKVNRLLGEDAPFARRAEALVLKGDAARALGRLEEAVQAYLATPAEWPDLRHYAVLQAGEVLQRQGKGKEARRLLARHAQGDLRPRHGGGAYLAWAECLRAAGQAEKAAEIARRGRERYGEAPACPDMLALIEFAADLAADTRAGRIAWLEAAREDARRAGQPLLASRLALARAGEFRRGGQPKRADASLLELAGHVEPEAESPETLAHVGNVLAALGSPEGTALLQDALDRFPDSPYADLCYLGLGRAAMERGNAAMALGWLSRIDWDLLEPAFAPPARFLLAEAQRAQGDAAAARETLERLLADRAAASDDKARALLELGNLLAAQTKLKEAVACYQRVYTLYPANESIVAECYLGAAALLVELGESAIAMRTCREFLEQRRLAREPAFAKAKRLLETLQARNAEPAPPQAETSS